MIESGHVSSGVSGPPRTMPSRAWLEVAQAAKVVLLNPFLTHQRKVVLVGLTIEFVAQQAGDTYCN